MCAREKVEFVHSLVERCRAWMLLFDVAVKIYYNFFSTLLWLDSPENHFSTHFNSNFNFRYWIFFPRHDF